MKLALIHDYLTQLGGAEKVLENFQRIFPNSPIFVLVNNRRKTAHLFSPKKIKTSWLQYLPLSVRNYQWYLTLMPLAIQSYKLDGYDIILSSASSIAKGIKIPKGIPHICYCHTPTRYLWHGANSYIEELSYNKLIKRIIPLFIKHLKNWDLLSAERVDYFIANSRLVQDRIKKYYGRDSTLIYPPVETDKFHISEKIDDYFLIGGRLVAYKRYDLAIRAFSRLGLKLKIFGIGPDYRRLKKIARKNIEFLGTVTDTEKAKLYSRAIAFIHPQIEDFGITAVESMAAGRPVIAYRAGGALETVVQHKTGEFFNEQIWESLADLIIHFQPKKFNPQFIKSHANKFNTQRFNKEIKEYVCKASRDYQVDKVFKIK